MPKSIPGTKPDVPKAMNSPLLVLVALAVSALLPCPGHAVTISNVLPRHNVSGDIIDGERASSQLNPRQPQHFRVTRVVEKNSAADQRGQRVGTIRRP